ncbi:MAG: DUF4968 domain-containing protein [Bacteroidetes bacterium]|nr:DUF4968 domain-containing protein [Bacteroidota bacterium]
MSTQQSKFLNHPLDIMDDFYQLENEYFTTGHVTEFDAATGAGSLQWNYHRWSMDWFFNKIDMHLAAQKEKAAPMQDYVSHPQCKFSLSFINSRTIRLRMKTGTALQQQHPSLMLDGEPEIKGGWKIEDTEDSTVYKSTHGKLILSKKNWKLELFDASGKLLNATNSFESLDGMHSKKYPFLFIKRSSDYSRSLAASFSLLPGEKIYGCGESFTGLNKRGQKVVLFACDTQSTAGKQMYKPIPFFMSNRGYGMFVHTTSPVTMDFGHTHDGSKTLFIGEDELDMFFFIGSPQEILEEYTSLTGKSSLTPLWSFGLWMGRFSYRSQIEVKSVADRMREHQIPCDVIHIDAGWFKKGINCDFEFGKELFPEPEKMISELRRNGFRTSLWQIPYATPLNPIFDEIVEKGLYVKDSNGNVPTEDAILDFSNVDTIKWYSEKIQNLLRLGISVIKTDFGEAAPLKGYYASSRSGFFEHNNYPLRYTQLVNKITKDITGESIIWSRSAWAGGQRNPVHWGGDAEVSDIGMAGSLRGGLSLGLCGFSFWSHDIGGFSGVPNEELFLRWTFFGMFSSHSRVHGFPPREPWEFSEPFRNTFRKLVELRYRLMPYIYTQSYLAAKNGLPLLKAMLLNYPEDPAIWEIDDQYLFGNDLLVAPIMEACTKSRNVYLPVGDWINYFTGETYSGKQWVNISTAELPGILLVKGGSLIPHIALAQSTAYMDWASVEMKAFSSNSSATGYLLEAGKSLLKVEGVLNSGIWKFE